MAEEKPKKDKVLPSEVVITSPVDPKLQMVIASELADDQIIENELMGEVMPFFVYQFNQDGNVVSGLTVKGVSEVVRRLNRDKRSGYKIRINPQYLTINRDVEYDGQKGVEVAVYAENLVDGNSAWGIKFEPYKIRKRDGSLISNKFALEKAISKAERNAKRKLIPEMTAVKMIEKIMKSEPTAVKQLSSPPPEIIVKEVSQPKSSTIDDIKNIIRRGIENSKDPSVIIEFDEKTQADKRFDKQFKDEIHKLANEKINAISQ